MTRKAWQFTFGAYLISWTAALLIWLNDIPYGSLTHTALIALFYMTGPAIAAIIVQKFIAKESLLDLGLKWRQTSWKYVLLAIPIVWLIMFIALAIIYLFGNLLGITDFGQVNFTNASVTDQIAQLVANLPSATDTAVKPLPFPSFVLLLLLMTQGAIAGAILNFPFAFGEELGWRGLLQAETAALGFVKSSLLIGIIWGLWHLPIIIQGHNYPGHPIAGVGMMMLFTTAFSFLFSYIRTKSQSIIGPTVLHGVLNAAGPGLAIFIANENPLIGSMAGLAGIMAILLTTGFILKLNNK